MWHRVYCNSCHCHEANHYNHNMCTNSSPTAILVRGGVVGVSKTMARLPNFTAWYVNKALMFGLVSILHLLSAVVRDVRVAVTNDGAVYIFFFSNFIELSNLFISTWTTNPRSGEFWCVSFEKCCHFLHYNALHQQHLYNTPTWHIKRTIFYMTLQWLQLIW